VVGWFFFFIFSVVVFFVPDSYSTAVAIYAVEVIIYLFLMFAFILIAIIFVIGHWSKVIMSKRSGDSGSVSGSASKSGSNLNILASNKVL